MHQNPFTFLIHFEPLLLGLLVAFIVPKRYLFRLLVSVIFKVECDFDAPLLAPRWGGRAA
jgi:hypothetical protein